MDKAAPEYDSLSDSHLDIFDDVTEDEVKSLIFKSPSKHCDLYPLPTMLLKNCIDELIPHITHILNVSLQTGSVPDCFKYALVNPLIKKTGLDCQILSTCNYRPVSNLLFLSKILEKVVLMRLLSHLRSNNLQEVFQSAYKEFHSTETALLKVFSDILKDSNKT